MPQFKIIDVHPDYVSKQPFYAPQLLGKIVDAPEGIEPFVHDEFSPLLVEGGETLDGWVGFPPWYECKIEGNPECPIAVKVEELV